MKKIPVSRPILSKKIKKFVSKAIDENALSGTYGNYIHDFEKKFSRYVKSKFAISTSNGTTALHTALCAFNIGKGDEVLVQSLTNMATAFAVFYTGAKIRPIDSCYSTCNIDPEGIEKHINTKTKAIVVVHLFGHPVDMDPIMSIAKKYNLVVIEDCAEAHGALYKNKNLGTIGDIGCYSFYANKILSTGEGGMVVTNNKFIAEKCRSLKSLNYGKVNRFNHPEIGFNYRMSNIIAAIGCAQIEDLNKIIEKKRYVANRYNEALSKFDDLYLPTEQSYAYNVYWVYHIICTKKLLGKRNQIMSCLAEMDIETRESFWPINKQDVFKNEFGNTNEFDCPIANSIGENGFYIPTGPDITEAEINQVIYCLELAIKKLTIDL